MGSWSNTLAVKSANYTVGSGDDGDTFILNASGYFQITYGAAGGYDSNHVNKLINPVTSARAVGVVINGLPTFNLYPGQSCWVQNTAGGGWFASDPGLWSPLSTPTFYVDPVSGSDTNSDGLASGGGATAFKTLGHAGLIAYSLDSNATSAIIQALGNLTEAVTLAGSIPGAGFDLQIVGNPSSPLNWTLPGGGSSPLLYLEDYATVSLNGFLFGFTSNPGFVCLEGRQFSICDIENCIFETCSVAMKVQDNARMNLTGPITIDGPMSAFMQVLYQGGIDCGGQNLVVGSIPSNVGVLFDVDGPGEINAQGVTFSGTTANLGGYQYLVGANGVLFQGGVSYPSNLAAGVVSTGGQVV